MSTLILLNHVSGTVELFVLSQSQKRELKDKYDNNVELWFSECRKGTNIRLDDCSWMFTDEFPEIFEHRNRDGRWYETQIYTTY